MRRLRVVRGVLATAAVAGALALAVWLFNPPQRRLVLAAGPEESAEYRFAQRYRAALARDGVHLEVLATLGMLDNLARLQDPKSGVDIALLEGGTTTVEASPDLASLGTLYFRPVWVFYRGRMPQPGEAWAPTLRVAVGPEGGSASDLAHRLLAESGASLDPAQLLRLEPDAAAQALIHGEADIASFVAPWGSPVVRQLLLADSVHLAGFLRSEARVALHPELTRLVLPQGVADLARNVPPADVQLVAPKVSLVVRRSLHPALQYLLLEAAVEVHGKASLFQDAGHFPAAEPGDLPLSKAALAYHKSGSPFLQRNLPFWVAVVLTQIGLLALPVLGIAYPLLRGAPMMYEWLMRHRVSRVYGELKLLELEMAEGKGGTPAEILARLDGLDARARRMQGSSAYVSMVYTLRQHIQLIRDRLRPG